MFTIKQFFDDPFFDSDDDEVKFFLSNCKIEQFTNEVQTIIEELQNPFQKYGDTQEVFASLIETIPDFSPQFKLEEKKGDEGRYEYNMKTKEWTRIDEGKGEEEDKMEEEEMEEDYESSVVIIELEHNYSDNVSHIPSSSTYIVQLLEDFISKTD